MYQAVFEIFPDTEVFGCRFHLGQAWYRKIPNLSYAPQFNSANDDVGKWLVLIFGLPFFNPEEVAECFTKHFMADKPENASITEFCDYLIDYYISNESIFPPKMWARQCSDRVHKKNACESFHLDFNSNFYHQHPNIFKIIEILKLFKVNTYIKMRTAISNQTKPKISKKYAEKVDFITEKISDYRTNKISQYDYFKYLSYRNKTHKI
uniref:MULE transposase domain-containing protein n=1 Tax=Sipha flava TaxID=143950 RepID=A0A2S2QVK6_9HEMI